MVTASGHRGVQVYGLFESLEECRQARTGLIEAVARAGGMAKKESRALFSEDGLFVTFSCLPLSEVRGLSLAPPDSE